MFLGTLEKDKVIRKKVKTWRIKGRLPFNKNSRKRLRRMQSRYLKK